MTSSATVSLQIGNAIPRANEAATGQILGLWQQFNEAFRNRSFTAQGDSQSTARPYLITLDAGSLLKTMENAKARSETFSAHRQAHIEDPGVVIDGALDITVDAGERELGEHETYQVASAFIQQLVICANLIVPGSCQLLDTRFIGPNAHRYEAQAFDSVIFYGAGKAAASHSWPERQALSLEAVWSWLEAREVSHVSTAIKDINKVLFTLLKIAEQRHEYSARTVLMVVYQLELLLNCRDSVPFKRIRNRTRLIFGDIPESADCFAELYEVRNSLFVASQPVHRPALICHTTAKAVREQVGQHNSAVDSGTALVLALLQDLIKHNARNYDFTENFSYR